MPVLYDAWAPAQPIPLSGVFERGRFAPWLTAVLLLVVGFVVYQAIAAVLMVVIVIVQGGDALSAMDPVALIVEYAQEFLLANAVGQFGGLLLIAWIFARLHTRQVRPFLRLRKPDAALTALAVVGLFVLLPVVQWLAGLTDDLPQPQWLEEQESIQQELLEAVLLGDVSVLFSLFAIALTPALCEEIVFRGYVQRQFERSGGVAAGIILSGVLFGLYHLRPSEAVALSVLGIYLAYLAWRTGSLWVPIIVHFVNNAFAVSVAAYLRTRPDLDLDALESIEVPWFLALACAAVVAGLVYFMQARAEALLAAKAPAPDSQPLATHE